MSDAPKEKWIRTCQECGHKQENKPPEEYKDERWRDLICRKCKSPALDFGRWVESDA